MCSVWALLLIKFTLMPDWRDVTPLASAVWCQNGLYDVFTVQRYAIAVYAVIMCLSVCLSVTLRYCIKTAKCRIMQILPHDSLGFLVFWGQKPHQNSNWITEYKQVQVQARCAVRLQYQSFSFNITEMLVNIMKVVLHSCVYAGNRRH